MQRVVSVIKEAYPSVFVHSVFLHEDLQKDRIAGYLGHLNDQIELVCQQLASIPELSQGFNAMGFSQGGLFLRAYIQRCNKPPIRTLVTWGSPHYGVSDLPVCPVGDFFCQETHRFLKFSVYGTWASKNIVQAQYFRDPKDYGRYLEYNQFLADINNEFEEKNQTYSKNIASLDRLVMIMFQNDTIMIPKESSWFQSYDVTTGELLPVDYTQMYREDWLGLKALDSKAGLEFVLSPNDHMQISDEDIINIIKRYFHSGSQDLYYDENLLDFRTKVDKKQKVFMNSMIR